MYRYGYISTSFPEEEMQRGLHHWLCLRRQMCRKENVPGYVDGI